MHDKRAGHEERHTRRFTEACTRLMSGRLSWLAVGMAFALGLLLTVATVSGGTFAWLVTPAAAGAGGSFRMANLELSVGSRYQENQWYIFSDNDTAIAAQLALEDLHRDYENYKNADEAMTMWLLEYKNVFSQILETGSWAGENGLMTVKYTISNTSNIPVYFRISRALIEPEYDAGIGATWKLEDGEEGVFIHGKDYFFCPEPLEPDAVIQVQFAVYINEYLSSSYSFLAKEAEIIQAANNAVHFVDGWEELASFLISDEGI